MKTRLISIVVAIVAFAVMAGAASPARTADGKSKYTLDFGNDLLVSVGDGSVMPVPIPAGKHLTRDELNQLIKSTLPPPPKAVQKAINKKQQKHQEAFKCEAKITTSRMRTKYHLLGTAEFSCDEPGNEMQIYVAIVREGDDDSPNVIVDSYYQLVKGNKHPPVSLDPNLVYSPPGDFFVWAHVNGSTQDGRSAVGEDTSGIIHYHPQG